MGTTFSEPGKAMRSNLTFLGFLRQYVKELSGESTFSIKRLASCCGDFPKLREPLFLYAVFSGQLQTLRSALQAESNESLQKLCDDFGDIVTLDILQKKAVYLWALSEENAGKSIPKPFSANGIVAKPGRIVTLIRISPEERQRTIQKSIAIPLWLNELAEKEDIDISQVLQEALKKKCTSNNHHTKKRHVSYCPAAFSGTAVSVLTFVPFFIFLHQRSLRTLHISLIVQGETTHTPLLAACRICPSLLQISFRF